MIRLLSSAWARRLGPLLDADHLIPRRLVALGVRQKRQHGVPARQIVVDPSVEQAEHVPKHRDPVDERSREGKESPDVAAKRRLVRLAREREGQRQGYAGIAFDDVGVVPNAEATGGLRALGENDGPSLKQPARALGVERPFDVLGGTENGLEPPADRVELADSTIIPRRS